MKTKVLLLIIVLLSLLRADDIDEKIEEAILAKKTKKSGEDDYEEEEDSGPTEEDMEALFADDADGRPQYKLVKPGTCPFLPGELNGTKNFDYERIQGPWMKLIDESDLAANYTCMASLFNPKKEKNKL